MTGPRPSIHEMSRDLRKRHRLTQAGLADMAGVSLPALQRFEAGNETARMDTVSKILSALGYELTIKPSAKEKFHDD